MKVATRFADGFANVGMRGKMDGCGNVVPFDSLLESMAIEKIRFDEGAPLNCPAMAFRKIVIDDWLDARPR